MLSSCKLFRLCAKVTHEEFLTRVHLGVALQCETWRTKGEGVRRSYREKKWGGETSYKEEVEDNQYGHSQSRIDNITT